MRPPAIKLLAVIFSLAIILSGCSSSGSGSSSPAPTATLTANPTSFTAGQGSSVLTFSSTNAESGSINNGEGAVGLKGSVRVTPAVTTTYTYTATGPGGTATAQATVTVVPAGPAPTVTLKASPSAIIAGQTVTLSWTTANASSIAISNLTDSSCSIPPCAVQPVASGSITVTPTTQTSYVATVTGDGQQVNSIPAVVSVNALTSFDGLPADPQNLGIQPQDVDPNGSVGTKQFVEYINIEYQAYDKATHTPVWPTPQMIGTPWTNTINQGDDPNCDGHAGSGGSLTGIHLDGEIHFDRLAQRWVVMGKADFSNSYYLCLAVSNTDDLSSRTLGWYGYDFQLDGLVGSTAGETNFPDWPKLGIWDDAYYVAFDTEIPLNLSTGGTNFAIGICAFDRNDILAQTNSSPPPVLGPVCVSPTVTLDAASKSFLGHSLIPAEIDGLTAPPAGRSEYMVSIENPDYTAAATTSTAINLWEAQVDWTGTPSLTITPTQLTVDSYTPGCYLYVTGNPSITNCVKEPLNGGQQIIDSVGDRLMPRFSYRNFGSYESYLISHTIQTGPGSSGSGPNDYQTGIRWYELRVNSGGTPYVYQQNTVNPDSELYRFLPSIAQDKDGNAVVAYSTSDIFSNPGISFSYWGLGTQNAIPTEVTILDGAGEEVTPETLPKNGVGQWGSYAEITVDPFNTSSPDCTFWYVNEYYPTSSETGWSTRIANFQVPGCQ